MIVYISGPMTGYVDFNRDAFYAAEKHLADQGFTVVNPAALDAADGSDTVIQPHALRRDIKALLDCDLIYLLPGWRHSKGATIEKAVADSCGIFEIRDHDVDAWRSFEGEPVCGHEQHVAKIDETLTCDLTAGHEGNHEGGNAWWVAEESPVEDAESDGCPEPGDEDLSDHPRFGSVFADGGLVVDPSLPPATIRLNYGCGDIDLGVTLGDDGLVLVPSRPLDEVSAVRPDDAFPNVGYVRRFKRLLGVE